MKICSNCGQQIEDSAKFCPFCGAAASIEFGQIIEDDDQTVMWRKGMDTVAETSEEPVLPVASNNSWQNAQNNNWQNTQDNSWQNAQGNNWQNNPGNSWQNAQGNNWQNAQGNNWQNSQGNSWQNAQGNNWQNNQGNNWQNAGNNQWQNNAGGMGNGYYNGMNSGSNSMVLQTTLSKMKTSSTLWMIIGICQIILGLLEICFGYGIVVIGVGIWNVINSGKIKKNIEVFRQNPRQIVPYFQAQNSTTIVFLVVNLFLGSIIGIIASIYDLTLDSYVKSNAMELMNL